MTGIDRDEAYAIAEEVVSRKARDLDRALSDAIGELRDELHTEVVALERRITEVHERALRELTRLYGKG